jgi:hypothetical protein
MISIFNVSKADLYERLRKVIKSLLEEDPDLLAFFILCTILHTFALTLQWLT